ncbi:MAG TPA: hypothetical protein VGF84_01690 [Micromonosporaceae bacterium]
MDRKLRTAVDFYIDGVVGGDLAAVAARCIADDLRQHTAGIADGRAAFVAAYQPLIIRHDRRFIRPVRGFVDGNTVVLQTFQSFGYRDIERIVVDLFDLDDAGRIREQWSVTTPLARISASGCSQLDGPTLVTDEDATTANKRVVARFAADVLMAGHSHDAATYVSPTLVDHHQQRAGTCRHSSPATGYGYGYGPGVRRRIIRIAASGNFAVVLSRMPDAVTVCDLYRLDAGMIVEHWDVIQPDPITADHRQPSNAVGTVATGTPYESVTSPEQPATLPSERRARSGS